MSLKPKKQKSKQIAKHVSMAEKSAKEKTKSRKVYRKLAEFPNRKAHNLYNPRMFYINEFDKYKEFGDVKIRFERTWRGRAEDGSDDLCRVIVTVPRKVLRPLDQSPHSNWSRFGTKSKVRPEAIKDFEKMVKIAEKEWSK